MSKYLYGASVQGIQEFIFKTNKLKEIIGASKIVEKMDSFDFQKEYNLQEKPEKLMLLTGSDGRWTAEYFSISRKLSIL